MQALLSVHPRLDAVRRSKFLPPFSKSVQCRRLQSTPVVSHRRYCLPSRVLLPLLKFQFGVTVFQGGLKRRQYARRCADPEVEEPSVVEYKSEEEIKAERSEALRQAEKFMVVGEGNATCSSCEYQYEVAKGDPDFPVPRGTKFQDTPDDYRCPLCGASKEKFRSSAKTIAGFAVNQGYGFGTNTMTGGQKQLLIYGALLAFFFLFIAGYFLN